MSSVLEANGVDHSTPEAAISAIEDRGHGNVVKFHLTRNREGCKPDYVHNSCAMWRYQNSKWTSWSIYGATSEEMNEEKPH